MKNKTMKKWIIRLLFPVLGALAGYLYYTYYPCPTGMCVITSSPASTMAYTGMIGWLVGYIFTAKKE